MSTGKQSMGRRMLRASLLHADTYEQIEADSDRDRWFTAEQAKDYGIIDHVIVRRGEMI